MNVGVLVASLPSDRTGGAEVQASTLAMLLAREHQVTVMTRSKSVPQALAAAERCDVRRRCRVSIPGVRFAIDIVNTLALIGSRRRNLDVIIAYQTVIDGLIGVLAKMIFRIPVIVSIRSEKEYQLDRDWKTRLCSPFVYRHADRVMVQTRTIENELLNELVRAGCRSLSREVARRIRVIPNGISLRNDDPMQGDAVLYVGRLVEAKGVHYLVQAMRHCPSETLVIVGDGPEMDRLRLEASGLDNVSFAGRVSREEIDDYYRKTKILVLPSLRDEGMPNAIMEAMVRGIPVVATRNAGIPDLVKDGETGFLVEPGDAEAIAHCINKIAADETLRAMFSRNSLREVGQYDWPNVLQSVERELVRLV